jgi:ubiquinone/menaquinone biosynthesis C-methylase UbiE
MSKEAFQLSDSAGKAYEDQKVTAMFGPLARATLDKVRISKDEMILDVACGTGIVARSIFEKICPVRPIVGADLNVGMIGMARQVTQADASRFEWHVASVEELPFEIGRFSMVICLSDVSAYGTD